jgi:hypothetical protein
MERCIHEQDWGDIKSTVKKLERDIEGNGKPGLRDSVTQLSVYVSSLNESVPALHKSVEQLLMFQSNYATLKDFVGKRVITIITIIGLLFSGINVAFSVWREESQQKTANSNQAVYVPVHTDSMMRDGSVLDTISKDYFPEQ